MDMHNDSCSIYCLVCIMTIHFYVFTTDYCMAIADADLIFSYINSYMFIVVLKCALRITPFFPWKKFSQIISVTVRSIKELEIHCSNKDRGCDWKGPLEFCKVCVVFVHVICIFNLFISWA